MDKVDCVVIGAGVIGLACARALSEAGREVIALERNGLIGAEISSRNSEVIHAGIYYSPGSLKARMCAAGKHRLYDYCESRGVPFRRCGKIIVATGSQQISVLHDYQRRAQANGLVLGWLDEKSVHELEPEVSAVAGLLSESTGIVDSHAFMLSLQGDLERAGALLALNTEVRDLRLGDRIVVATDSLTVECNWLINCAGLHAPDLARLLASDTPPALYARGHYFAYSGAAPFSRLVYPIAEPGGLGIHVTLDMGGQVKFGPDVVWQDGVDYSFDEGVKDAFVAAIRSYYPAVEADRLHSSYTGIRPKIVAAGEPDGDFRIDGPQVHGVDGLISLLGIESPGLTASLAIAESVAAQVCR